MNRSVSIGLLGFLLGVASLSFNVGQALHIPVGGGRGPLMLSGLGPSEATWNTSLEEVADSRRDFYFRKMESMESRLSIPLQPLGPFDLAMRMDSTVRTKVDLFEGEGARGEAFATPGPWAEVKIAERLDAGPLEFGLRFQDAPLVRRSDTDNFRRYVDEVVLRGDEGFKLPWTARITGGLLMLLLLAFVALVQPSAPRAWSVALAFVGPAALAWLSFEQPVALSLALPRLLGFVVAGAGLVWLLGLLLRLGRAASAVLALLASAMIFVYGLLSFLPNHSPADLDIHIWRTLDLGNVPLSYDAWLRYGSHYPTTSQIRGSATEALGEGAAIPYSPLPYVVFFAAHAAGLDLHWSMNAIEATSLALLLPLVFALARGASTPLGGYLAAALMALDLATIHHLGRAHAPAVLGGAWGLFCLLAFGLAVPRIAEPGRFQMPGLLLGLGALGYSSTPLFYALFGITIVALTLAWPESRSLARPIALAFGMGGAIALVLYYGHYLPGLLSHSGTTFAVDPFPGRTFFVFHNESRQSLRLWRLGLFIPFLAAAPAAWLMLKRGSAPARPFLLAWLSAWALMMLLKEPFALPVLLRWAKEDFYVAPALAMLIAIAIARLDASRLRIGLTTLTLVAATLLRARDYGFHADTLRFLK